MKVKTIDDLLLYIQSIPYEEEEILPLESIPDGYYSDVKRDKLIAELTETIEAESEREYAFHSGFRYLA